MSEPVLAIALARELLHGTGALRVTIALDGPEPALVECERLRAIVVRDGAGVRELAVFERRARRLEAIG